MPSEANFLAAIREDPDDDAVRLIFADCSKNRATLRVQNLSASRWRAPPFAPRSRVRKILLDREAELLAPASRHLGWRAGKTRRARRVPAWPAGEGHRDGTRFREARRATLREHGRA